MSRATLSAIVKGYKEDLIGIQRMACGELAARVVRRTPVDKGDLRKSWTPSIGEPDYSNKGGSFAAVANRLKPGDNFSLGNGQPYVRVIEYQGHSPQAPAGMLHVSAAEWPSIVQDAVNGR